MSYYPQAGYAVYELIKEICSTPNTSPTSSSSSSDDQKKNSLKISGELFSDHYD